MNESTKNQADALSEKPPVDSPTPAIRPRSRQLLSRQRSALLIVDVQQKLLPHIQHHELVLWNIRRLVDGAELMNIAQMCTEQYPKGLGPTVPVLADRVSVDDEKSLFSCRECENVAQRLSDENKDQVLVCGIETHVCIMQTVLDLQAFGYDVFVPVDAVGSRFDLDHQTALQRMQAAGATLTTTEAALFEWCEASGTHEFKRVSGLVREQAPEKLSAPDARFFPRLANQYIVQSAHNEGSRNDNQTVHQLQFIVRKTDTGDIVEQFTGQLTRRESDDQVSDMQGIQAVQITQDGTAISIQNAAQEIRMVYLPIGDPRTNHPRWKVRKTERHINSPEYKHDYEIRFNVVDHKTDETFREFVGYEHRNPDDGSLTLVSGVRQIEISADGKWMVITRFDHAPELLQLPAE